jgi:hypothetical protein
MPVPSPTDAPAAGRVLIERREHVALVTINRPDVEISFLDSAAACA